MQIKRVHIKNFKSIVDLQLDLAPINVFIGENGSGKSNILEALAFAAAAAANKLDNEFLVSRGIRVTDPRFMRSAFADAPKAAISVDVEDERGVQVAFEFNTSSDTSYPRWQVKDDIVLPQQMLPPPLLAVPFIEKTFAVGTEDARKSITQELVIDLGEFTSNTQNINNLLDELSSHTTDTISTKDTTDTTTKESLNIKGASIDKTEGISKISPGQLEFLSYLYKI